MNKVRSSIFRLDPVNGYFIHRSFFSAFARIKLFAHINFKSMKFFFVSQFVRRQRICIYMKNVALVPMGVSLQTIVFAESLI